MTDAAKSKNAKLLRKEVEPPLENNFIMKCSHKVYQLINVHTNWIRSANETGADNKNVELKLKIEQNQI